jgi:chaperonin cofactor prefoldin
VYIGLELEDTRYLKVQLMNASGREGYITVIDGNDSSVQKAFGMLLLQMSQQEIEQQLQQSSQSPAQ